MGRASHAACLCQRPETLQETLEGTALVAFAACGRTLGEHCLNRHKDRAQRQTQQQ